MITHLIINGKVCKDASVISKYKKANLEEPKVKKQRVEKYHFSVKERRVV